MKSQWASTVRWGQNMAPNAIERHGRKNARRKLPNSATRASPIASSLVAVRAASHSEPGCASSMYRRSSSKKNERPGDSWRKRYKSLCLHDPVWYDHLPYLPFPRHWPVFSPKDKIGDWLEMYTKVMELNYWGSTECKKASYDEKSREWTVVVQRDGKEIVLKPKQLVLATGMSAKPYVPKLEGMDIFKGDQHHSSQHPVPDKYKHKKP